MKVLVVGLDATTTAFLERQGVTFEIGEDVQSAEDLESWLASGLYDACVADIDQGLGVYVGRALRAKKLEQPLIGISRNAGERSWSDYRALFLENGGDDLLKGPPHPRELVATLRAAARRFQGGLMDIVQFQNGKARLKINLTTRSVSVNSLHASLTGREAALLLELAAHPGRTLSQEALVREMYTEGVDDPPEVKIIDVFICKIRRKLSELHPDAGALIETVWGTGYRLVAQPVAESERNAA